MIKPHLFLGAKARKVLKFDQLFSLAPVFDLDVHVMCQTVGLGLGLHTVARVVLSANVFKLQDFGFILALFELAQIHALNQ